MSAFPPYWNVFQSSMNLEMSVINGLNATTSNWKSITKLSFQKVSKQLWLAAGD
jgi:hypothetical protein